MLSPRRRSSFSRLLSILRRVPPACMAAVAPVERP